MFYVAHRTPSSPGVIAEFVLAGATYFEVDILADAGRLVVSHYLPVPGLHRWLERDNGRFRRRRGSSPDPTLAEVLRRLPPTCSVLLDPKDTTASGRAQTTELLAELPDVGRFCVSTRFDEDLATLRSAGFSTWRTVDDERDLQAVLALPSLADDGVSIRHRLLTTETFAALKQRTSTVVAWTVNQEPVAARMRALGVDGLTTDRVELMRVRR